MDDNSATVSAFDYLSALYQDCTTGDIVFTRGGNKVAAVFSCTQIEDAAAFIGSYDACDLYLKVNLMDHERTVARNPHGVGGTGEVDAIVSFHLDIDCNKSEKYPTRDEALQALDSMPMKPSVIVDTNGPDGGFHAYWLLDCPIMLDDEKTRQTASQASRNWLQLLRKRLPGKTVDGTANIDRVLRPIGSMRSSGNRVSAFRFEPAQRYSFDAFAARIPKTVEPVQIARRNDSESVIAKYLDCKNITVRSILQSQGYVEIARGEWIRQGSESGARTGVEHTVDGREGFTVYSGNVHPLSCDNGKGGTGNWYSRETLWLSFEFNVDANQNPRIWQEAADAAKKELDQQAMEGVCMDQIVRSIDDSEDDEAAIDDEAFARSMVPDSGLLRELHDAYWESSFRRCSVMGLAASVAVVQTVIGRKLFAPGKISPNEYHLIFAPSGSGKEAALSFATKLLHSCEMILPERMQSGNGLLKVLSERPCALWAADEFGYVLESVLDKRGKDANQRQIANHLLSLYGKASSVFTGSAYAGQRAHEIEYPHLNILGVGTPGSVWRNIDASHIADGLLGRIVFWKVSEMPSRNTLDGIKDIPTEMFERIQAWANWTPGGGNLESIHPHPVTMQASADALDRWTQHQDAIDLRGQDEGTVRRGLWARVAARSMKFALAHRVARLIGPEEINEFNDCRIELQDIDWGIRLSNWTARLSCDLVDENVVDDSRVALRSKITGIVRSKGEVRLTQITRALRSYSGSDIRSMLHELDREQVIRVVEVNNPVRGRPFVRVCWVGAV